MDSKDHALQVISSTAQAAANKTKTPQVIYSCGAGMAYFPKGVKPTPNGCQWVKKKEVKPIPDISNEDMIEIKGFDKYNFRSNKDKRPQ